VRFGDPETQVILPLIETDWGLLFYEVACGRIPQIKQKSLSACCVVLAAPGYPDHPQKNVPLVGDPLLSQTSSYFLHAGTRATGDGWVTNGGRVLNSIGVGSSKEEALKHAYALIDFCKWPGMQFRRDIGQK
jgi:phosphoribosylamine--glycine ligase